MMVSSPFIEMFRDMVSRGFRVQGFWRFRISENHGSFSWDVVLANSFLVLLKLYGQRMTQPGMVWYF